MEGLYIIKIWITDNWFIKLIVEKKWTFEKVT